MGKKFMRSWSDMTTDLLEQVTTLLSWTDQQRFSAVCRSWRLVVKLQKRACKPELLPWLVLGEDPKTKKRNFFSMSEQRNYSIDIPELYGQFICGSSYGWFLIVDSKTNGRLLNPFTKECYQLPPFPPYSHVLNISNYDEEMQKKLVYKAILSHDPSQDKDFIVIILFGCPNKLGIWRPSDTTTHNWTVMEKPQCAMVDIFYFQGLLYAVKSSGNLVYVIDVGGGSNPTIKEILENGETDMIRKFKYLMVFKGELLLVTRYQSTRTKRFLVRTHDQKRDRWCKLANIDGYAVFVGNNSPIIVNPTTTATGGGGNWECIRNGIYFSDVNRSYFWRLIGHDFGVHDMVEDTILLGQLSSSTSTSNNHPAFHPPDAALTWFTPSPE